MSIDSAIEEIDTVIEEAEGVTTDGNPQPRHRDWSDETENVLADRAKEIRELRGEIDRLTGDYLAAAGENRRMDTQLAEARATTDRLRHRLDEELTRVGTLQSGHDLVVEGFVAQVAEAREMNGRLRGEVNSLVIARDDLRTEFDRFKERVVSVAAEYAEEHGWCAVVDEALDELGLKREPKTYDATLTITVEFTGTLKDRRETVTDDWVEQSLTGMSDIRSLIRDSLGLDRDHDGISINEIHWEVTDVDANE